MQNFYIVTRKGDITEVPFTEENYEATLRMWKENQRILVKPRGHQLPIGINAADISHILDEATYETHVRTAKPRLYIKDGVWFDSKERCEVFAEPYVKERRAEQRALQAKEDTEEPPSPEMQARIEAIRANIRQQLSRTSS